MLEALHQIVVASGPVPIRLQAQAYLADTLYKSLGFEPISDVAYDEDGIPHVDMLLAVEHFQNLVFRGSARKPPQSNKA